MGCLQYSNRPTSFADSHIVSLKITEASESLCVLCIKKACVSCIKAGWYIILTAFQFVK